MEGRAALWTMIGIFVMFKVATTIMIIRAAPEAAEAIVAFFIAFHWPFILAAIILFLQRKPSGLFPAKGG